MTLALRLHLLSVCGVRLNSVTAILFPLQLYISSSSFCCFITQYGFSFLCKISQLESFTEWSLPTHTDINIMYFRVGENIQVWMCCIQYWARISNINCEFKISSADEIRVIIYKDCLQYKCSPGHINEWIVFVNNYGRYLKCYTWFLIYLLCKKCDSL